MKGKIKIEEIGKNATFNIKFSEVTKTFGISTLFRNQKELLLPDLYDLRDRALLMINNQQNWSENEGFLNSVLSENLKKIYDIFISSIESLNNIITNMDLSFENGYPIDKLYQKKDLCIKDQDNKEILEFEKHILIECEKWQAAVIAINKKHKIMNYFWGKELINVPEMLRNKDKKVMEHLYFVNPNISKMKIEDLPEYFHIEKNPIKELEVMAKYLENLFSKIPGPQKIHIKNENQMKTTLDDITEKIVVVKVESYKYYINGFLIFLRDYDNYFPLANQVLFCNFNTSWQELRSFLFRLVFNPMKQFYTLIGPERLNFENQDRFLNCYQTLLEEFQEHFVKLAIITNDPNSHIVYNLYSNKHIKIVKFENSRDILREDCCKELILNWEKNVTLVTSAYSGLGKTTYIKNSNKENNLPMIRYSISNCDGFSVLAHQLKIIKKKIVNTNKNLDIHFDILNSNNDEYINEFLFNFIFLKVFKFDDFIFTTENVKNFYIEIANTFKEQLRQRIYFASLFENFKNNMINDFDVTYFSLNGSYL